MLGYRFVRCQDSSIDVKKIVKQEDVRVTTMRIIIKKMETEDEINGKGYVHWKSWQESYKGIVNQEYLDNLTLDKCVASAHKWPNNVLIAKDGDNVIGFLAYGECRNEDLIDAFEVMAIYVLSEYYGCGIGFQLMAEAIKKLNNHNKIVVWVLKDNKRAIRFYQRLGFTFDGTEATLKLGTEIVERRMILVL